MRHYRFLLLITTILALIILADAPRESYSQDIVAHIIVEQIAGGDTPFVQDTDYPEITLYVTPVNETGVPISGLDRLDFVLQEDGISVENFTVESFIDPDIPISLMLLLDISGSMRGDLEELRESALVLYDYLELTDRSAIIAFNEMADGTTVDLSDPFPQLNPDREMDFTNDGGALINLITGLEIEQGAGTPLYDALFKGVRLTAMRTDFGRRAVILMTDGVDENRFGRPPGSRVADANIAISEAQRHGIPVFTIGLGYQIDDAFLQRAATLTGGVYKQTPDAAALGDLFIEVATSLKLKYRLTYNSQIAPDDALHNLTIRVGDAEETVSFKARYPVVPWVRSVQAALPRQEMRSLDTLEGVKGTVTLQPDIAARAAIAEVNYYVNDELTFVARQAPWTFVWNTRDLAPEQEYALRIEAVDDTGQANVGVLETQVLVQECSIICLLEQATPIDPIFLLGGVGVLLLLLVLFMVTRRRAEEPAPQPAPASPTFPGNTGSPIMSFPPPQPPTPPPPGPTRGINVSGAPGPFAGSPAAGAGSRPSPKTEVLRKAPEKVAFLIDPKNNREFRLMAETAIGREAGNDIILDDSAISSRHAKIKLEKEQFVLYDLAATNPTKVNGAEITRQPLKEGDRLEIGRFTLIFKQVK